MRSDYELSIVTDALGEINLDMPLGLELVGDMLRAQRVTRAEFQRLDSEPGRWGRADWHWKLRRFRNGPGFKDHVFYQEG